MDQLNTLKIHKNGHSVRLPVKRMKSIVQAVYRKEKITLKRESHLICCSDYTIRKFNRIYRKKDKVTDVLSFCFSDEDLLGEIYISLKRTEIQARRYGVSFNEEFLRLFTHGLMHLAGYDHLKESDRLIMEEREKYYLSD